MWFGLPGFAWAARVFGDVAAGVFESPGFTRVPRVPASTLQTVLSYSTLPVSSIRTSRTYSCRRRCRSTLSPHNCALEWPQVLQQELRLVLSFLDPASTKMLVARHSDLRSAACEPATVGPATITTSITSTYSWRQRLRLAFPAEESARTSCSGLITSQPVASPGKLVEGQRSNQNCSGRRPSSEGGSTKYSTGRAVMRITRRPWPGRSPEARISRSICSPSTHRRRSRLRHRPLRAQNHRLQVPTVCQA